MLRETGRIVAVETGAAWVETIRSSACGRCAARAGCGHGVLAGSLGTGRGLIRVVDGPSLAASDCEPGDAVEIELPESSVLIASAMVYGLPLVGGVLAALVATRFGELAAVLGFVAGMLSGFAGVRLLTQHAGASATFEPRLVDRLGATDADLIVRAVTG